MTKKKRIGLTVAQQRERDEAKYADREKHPYIKCARDGCRRQKFIQKTKKHMYCSKECKQIAETRAGARANMEKRVCIFDGCQQEFAPLRSDQLYCQAACRLADYEKDFLVITLRVPKNLLTVESRSATLVVEIESATVAGFKPLSVGE